MCDMVRSDLRWLDDEGPILTKGPALGLSRALTNNDSGLGSDENEGTRTGSMNLRDAPCK